MNILLLEKFFKPSDIGPVLNAFFDAIKNDSVNIYLFTSTDSKDFIPNHVKARLAGIQYFDHYYTTPLIELAAINLNDTFPFERVIALREFDLIRAANIRTYLKIPGPNSKQIEIFRDKYLMKCKALSSGYSLKPFAAIDNSIDLLNFIKKISYPIIVKPRKKGGGLGFQHLRDDNELEKYLNMLAKTTDVDQNLDLIAEKYLDMPMMHIDGVFHKGKPIAIIASEYVGLKAHHNFSAEAYYATHYSGSLTLDPSSAIAQTLCSYTEMMLNHFDSISTYGFHVELWVDDNNNNIFLNEIAARMGGGYVYNLTNLAFELPLEKYLFKYLCLEDETIFQPLLTGHVSCVFSGKIPTNAGKIISIPKELNQSSPDFYRCDLQNGDIVNTPTACYDNMGFIATRGSSPSECLSKFDMALNEFREKTILESA